MANYDPSNYDMLFVLLGHRDELDASTFATAVRGALEPWYAFPFPASPALAAPRWVRRPDSEMTAAEIEQGVTQYVASSGTLATRLPGSQGDAGDGTFVTFPAGRYPFNTQWPFVTGLRWVLQQKVPATAQVTRGPARAALRDRLRQAAATARGEVVASSLLPYATRSQDPAFNMPFPSVPSLPGPETSYKSGAIFVLLAGAAVGAVGLAASRKGR